MSDLFTFTPAIFLTGLSYLFFNKCELREHRDFCSLMPSATGADLRYLLKGESMNLYMSSRFGCGPVPPSYVTTLLLHT